MFRRIDAVVAAGEDGDSAGHEGGAVGGGVYAAGEARNDAEAGLAEIARQPFRELDAGGGGVAGADNGDPGAREASRWPRTAISGGASSIIFRRAG